MISYLQAVRELDARWTGSLQFLPPTPSLRSAADCVIARQIATTEVDLFNRYAKEIAAANGLKLGLLVDLYDMLLSTGLIFTDELYEVQSIRCQQPAPNLEAPSSAPRHGDRSPDCIERIIIGSERPFCRRA